MFLRKILCYLKYKLTFLNKTKSDLDPCAFVNKQLIAVRHNKLLSVGDTVELRLSSVYHKVKQAMRIPFTDVTHFAEEIDLGHFAFHPFI